MPAATLNQPTSTWSESDSLIAASQGWGLFDTNADGTKVEIQKCDESKIFANDAAAEDFLKVQAAAGDSLAIKALEVAQAA